MEKSRHMSEENKAETRRFIEEAFDQANLDVLDELVPPEWLHHDPASPEEERGSEGALRQRREICEPLKGNAKIELGLSAGLNPSGASNLDLKQRTEPSNEKAGG